jgi:predicted dehydrogenase
MGVYDVATLVDLLGPVAQVSGFGRQINTTRTVRQGPAAGTDFAVVSPTHVVAALRFAEGPLATLTSSFDGFGSAAAGVEIIGTTAALRIGHSSRFEGAFSLSTRLGQWEPLPAEADGWSDALWIIGLLDLVAAVADGGQPHCTARRALHHLAVLEAIAAAITTGDVIAVGHASPPALSAPPGHFGALRQRFGLGQDKSS